MGFGGLVPAEQLCAVYDPFKQVLTLYAEGEVQKFTYGFDFIRADNFVGGLKYSLYGWTGPLAKGLDHYKHHQEFTIRLLTDHYVVNREYVTIVTANDIQGKLVKIRWLGLEESGDLQSEPASKDVAGLQEKSLTSSTPPTTPIIPLIHPPIIEPSKHLSVLFDIPFEIEDVAEVSKIGGNTIKFDPTFLAMLDAGNKSAKVLWKFNSLKMGKTQIEVTSSYGDGSIWSSRTTTYDVFIFVLPLGPLLPPSSSPTLTGETLSYLGNVNIAVDIVHKSYPKAEMYEVEAQLPKKTTPATIDPRDLTKLSVVFQNVDNSTVIIDSGNARGTWDTPQLIAQPWFEDIVIPWPIKLEIVDAVDLMRKAGFTEPFYNCTLRHLLKRGSPEDKEPCYIFELETGKYVFVGVYSHKVFDSITPFLKFGGSKHQGDQWWERNCLGQRRRGTLN